MGSSRSKDLNIVALPIMTGHCFRQSPSTLVGNLPNSLKENAQVFDMPFHKSIEEEKGFEMKNELEEIGKQGEDNESKIINRGKETSFLFQLGDNKKMISKRLPPILQPPIPNFDNRYPKLIKHKPNINLINQLFEREQHFDSIVVDIGYIDQKDETILSILNELSSVRIS